MASVLISLGHVIFNFKILSFNVSISLPWKGTAAVVNSNNKTPMHQISTASLCAFSCKISGAKYIGVPQTVVLFSSSWI